MDTERTGSATQPFIAPPPVAEGGASSPRETFHELVGRLALPLWGLTALSVADKMGLLDALGEPQSVDMPSMFLRGGTSSAVSMGPWPRCDPAAGSSSRPWADQG